MVGLILGLTLNSCKKDDEDDNGGTTNPIASFQYEVGTTNFLEVTFTNYSQNATSYEWDFGDGESSTEKDPVHVYAQSGNYTVKLTAKNSAGTSADFSEAITITDPDDAYKLLTGDVSKTWKLFREGTSMTLDPHWEGLMNDGARPCLYTQEFTFHFDGTYEFNDNGMFWGEYGVFDGKWNYEICFEALAENMINKDDVDVSAWLSGTHAFTYNTSAGTATLTGEGAWIGVPKLTTAGETTVPVASTTFDLAITEEEGYDLMTVNFDYGDGGLWTIIYVHYYDPDLEPELVTVEPPYGEDLPDLTPDAMWNTFETSTTFELLDTAAAWSPTGGGTAANSMELTLGVADPAGGATNVGQYVRVGTWQELQFQMEYDIQFNNFTTVSVDVYMPGSNDYTTLTKDIAFVIGDASETDGWWTGHIQYDATAEVLDEWVTYTFQLDSPTSGPGGYTPYTNDKLDFFAISLGGGGHEAPGTFYIRNFVFN